MRKKRMYGLDLFRMFSMFCVIVLHLLNHGGALSSTVSTANFATVSFWGTLTYPAVNCFVLLSGFVGYRDEKYYPRIRNILSVVFSTFFYSVVFFVVYTLIFSGQVSLKLLAYSLLPITTGQYWFVSAYFAVFLLSPFINMFVHKANRKMLFCAIVAVLVLSIPSMALNTFDFQKGHGVIWLSILYLLGAMIRKENLLEALSPSKGLLCISLGLLVTWGAKFICHLLGSPFSLLENLLLAYCSPTVLLMAIGWMVLFSKIKTAPAVSKGIAFLTPSVFSVYLIHDNMQIRKMLITDQFIFINQYNPILTTAVILLTAIAIFVGCLLIDQIRVLLFKLLGISKLIAFMEKTITTWLQKIFTRFVPG